MSPESARSSALHQLWVKLPQLSKKAATTLLLAGIWLGVESVGITSLSQWLRLDQSQRAILNERGAAIAQTSPIGPICPNIDLDTPTFNQANANSVVTGLATGGEAVAISRVDAFSGAPVNFRTAGAEVSAELVKTVDQSTNWTSGGLTPGSASVPDYIRFDSRDSSANGAAPTYRLKFEFDQPVTNPVVSFSGTANREIVASVPASLVSTQLTLNGSSGGNGGTLPVPTATAITNGVRLTGAHGSDRFNASLQISGTVTTFFVDLNPTTDTSTWVNSGGASIWSQIDNMGVTVATATNCSPAPARDYGDAPDTYGTDNTSNNSGGDPVGPSHTIVSGLHLGTTPDAETDGQPTVNADGDGFEDDGISLPAINEGDTAYAIPASNIAATGTGTLHGWVDFDRDGKFEVAEYASVFVNNGAPTGALTFGGFGSFTAGAAGNTYARFRFTSDNSINFTTPGGVASNGEVEDYLLAIAPMPFTGIIGTPAVCPITTVPTSELAAIPDGSTTYTYTSAGGGDRNITIQKVAGSDSVGGSSAPMYNIPGSAIVAGIWLGSDDRYPAKFAGAGLDEETYELSFNDDVTQTQLTFAAMNFNGDGDERIEIVRIEDGTGNNITSSTTFGFVDGTPAGFGSLQFNSVTGRIEGSFYQPGGANGTYGNSNGTLTIDRSAGLRKIVFKRIEIDNPSSSKVQPASNRTNGVTLGPITYCGPAVDYGDAPDTYGTDATANNSGSDPIGASHTIVSGLHLGTAPDSENDAATPLDGSGDGAEDDGITLTTLTEGDVDYTIPAGNITATGTGTLHGWVDFDNSGTFEPTEHTSVGIVSGTPAGALSWSGITAGAAGNTYARFRFTSDASITLNTPGGAAGDGEVEDYVVAIAAQPISPVGNICPIVDLNTPAFNQANANSSVTGTAVGGEGITISRVDINSGLPVNFRTGGANATAELVKNTDQSTGWLAGGITPVSTSVPDYIRFDSRDADTNGAAAPYRLQFEFDQPVTNPVVSFSGTANREIVASTSAALVSSALILDGSTGGNGGTLPTPTATAIANGVRLTGAHGSDQFNVSLQISGTVTSFFIDLSPTTDTSTWTNSGGASIWSQIDNMGVTVATADNCSPPSVDYGDAPDTYGTDVTANNSSNSSEPIGPSHTIVSGLQLGTAPDSETDAATPLDGSGDGAEDDGIILATLSEGDTSYTIPAGDIAATGTGTLHAWLDFDKSGTFEPGEHTSIGVTSGTPAGDLTWTGITAGTVGDTYARFRFTSDASINANTPGGAASDGEVEDYVVAIAPATSVLVSAPICNPDEAFTTWDGGGPPANGSLVGASTSLGGNQVTWTSSLTSGSFSSQARPIYQEFADNLRVTHGGGISNLEMTFDVPTEDLILEVADLLTGSERLRITGYSSATAVYPQFIELLRGATIGGVNNNEVFDIDGDSSDQGAAKYTFSTAVDRIVLENVGAQSFVIYRLYNCQADFGDAPNTYNTLFADDGARHTVNSNARLGSAVSGDANGFGNGVDNSLDATDDADDGVQLNNASLQGQSLTQGETVDLDIESIGSGVLNAWVDWNGNGDFADAGEQVAIDADVSGGTLSVPIPAGATVGSTYARFRYSSDTGLAPTGLASDGEVEDYLVAIATPSTADLLVVERITAINRGQANEQLFDTTFEDVTTGVANAADNYANWPTPIDATSGISDYLAGAIGRGLNVGDEVEYTVYFISSGTKPITNVRICDMVPINTTYVAGSMELSHDGTTTTLSDTGADIDGGEFISAPTVPTTPCPKPTNDQGAVVVTVVESPTTIPNATAPGIPAAAYGYVRFRVTVN